MDREGYFYCFNIQRGHFVIYLKPTPVKFLLKKHIFFLSYTNTAIKNDMYFKSFGDRCFLTSRGIKTGAAQTLNNKNLGGTYLLTF
jgi:hypothetical protein